MMQYGGEGKEKYKGKKSDMGLPQHGGEGHMMKMGGNGGLLKCSDEYRGPGYKLGKK